ncbi:MAG: hypothetical protein JXR37_32915 [Kiritimatiellae bacterium]|nr:hypothetical protein [Kiritimatiellia bacterium]
MKGGAWLKWRMACAWVAAVAVLNLARPAAAAPDVYEPDDTNATAVAFEVGTTQTHSFHSADDEDWVKLFFVGGDDYEIETTHLDSNLNTAVRIWHEKPTGELEEIWFEDLCGTNEGELTWICAATDPVGVYYLQVLMSPEFTNEFAEGQYELRITGPTIGGGFLVVAGMDMVGGVGAPPGAVAVVDGPAGVCTQEFNGAMTVDFGSLTATCHQVSVPAVPGYWPVEDPVLTGQVANADSELYGNPRNKMLVDDAWRCTAFMFYPMVRVQGVVRDDRTAGLIEGAALLFEAKSGTVSGTVYTAYQNTAWGAKWATDADGSFPDDQGGEGVLLPTAVYDLTLSNLSGGLFTITNAIPDMPEAGTTTNLGTIQLTPVDGNTNNIADSWEEQYFGAGTNVVGTEDADNDGIDNWGEYVCGTDPTNGGSALSFDEAGPALGTNEVTLAWGTVPGRSYQIGRATILTGEWDLVAGPWEATNGQTGMQWTDSVPASETNYFYRIEVVVP